MPYDTNVIPEDEEVEDEGNFLNESPVKAEAGAVEQDLLEVVYRIADHVFPNGAEKHKILELITDHMLDRIASNVDPKIQAERDKAKQDAEEKQKVHDAKSAERAEKLRAMEARRANR